MRPKLKRQNRIRRHMRIRSKIFGTAERPRLSVFRSHKNIFLQLIDDVASKTLVSSSSREIKSVKGKAQKAFESAKLLSERAQKAGITKAVFDRGGYKFHGRVKKVAEAAAETGLKI